MDSNHLFSEKEARWLFGDEVLSLQELAAFQFAWNLWRDFMSSGKYHDIKSELCVAVHLTVPIVLKFLKGLKLAPSVEKELLSAACQIKHQLTLWNIYNREQMLSGRKITLYTCHVKYIVFHPSTELDYEGSARKMISANQFDKRTTFEIMCRYCMEDELKTLPKDEVKGFLKKIKFEKCPLAWYWICHLTDKKMLDGLAELACLLQGRCCLESNMILSMDVDNWQNIEWFWRHLCDETDQMNKAVEVLRNIDKTWFLREFYHVLNENQWRHVFNTIPVDILYVFFREYKEPEQGYFLWTRLKDTITGEQFVNLMQRLLMEKTQDWCFPTTTKLWNTAPDHLKNHVLYCGNHVVVNGFFKRKFIRKFDKNLQFIFELLTFASIEYREKVILTHGDVLFEIDDFSKIDRIIELCLPNASQHDQFKKFLAKSKMFEFRCVKLFVNGKFALLNKLFGSYLPDVSVANVYRKQLLGSKKTCKAFIFEPSVWCEVEKFVGSVYPNSPHRPAVRNQILRSCKLDYFDDWKNVEQLDHLENVLVRFFFSEKLDAVKTRLISELQNKLVDFFTTYVSAEGKFFTAEFLQNFVLWSNGDHSVLKSKLSIDSIFISTIISLLSVIRFENWDDYQDVHKRLLTGYDKVDAKILVALDEFLKWYFGGVEQAKGFKLAKIFDFDNSEFFQELNNTAKIDDRNCGTVLVWMLENDIEQIQKFKAECTYEDILKAI